MKVHILTLKRVDMCLNTCNNTPMKSNNVGKSGHATLRVDMDAELKDRLESYLAPRGLKKAWFIRRALTEALDRAEECEKEESHV